MQNPRLRRILAALAAFVATVGLTIVVAPDHTVTVHVGKKAAPIPNATTVAGPDAKRDNVIKLDPSAKALVRQANAAPDTLDLAGDLRGRDPNPAGVLAPPLAAPSWPGCRTSFVRNFSTRHGQAPQLIWLHYTGGGERPGWSDIDGLTAYSNNPASQVSWHFNIDREGHCAYTVPLQYKAWTEAGANSTGIGIEVVGTGSEPEYAGGGFKRLAAVVIRVSRLYGIPLRLGAVTNCSPTRSGIVTHWMGGPCSGGHIDIKPYSLPAVIARIRALAVPAVSSLDRLRCARLNRWRQNSRPAAGTHPAVLRKRTLAAHKVLCDPGRPARKA